MKQRIKILLSDLRIICQEEGVTLESMVHLNDREFITQIKILIKRCDTAGRYPAQSDQLICDRFRQYIRGVRAGEWYDPDVQFSA